MSNNEMNFMFKQSYSQIISFFISNPDKEYYVNQILKEIKISPKVLCESLKELSDKGILNSEKRANAIYYSLNKKNKILEPLRKMFKPITYKDAGVDIDAGNKAVELMKPFVKSTFNENVIPKLGFFSGLYKLDIKKYKEPILVSSSDGVGTKLKLAYMTNKHDTIGQDLVNHCVNDILVAGAKPLFFQDYIGSGKLNPYVIRDIVKGLSIACKQNGVALVGGETAELPGLYKEKEYDLASFIVGVVEKDEFVDGSKIKIGDKVIGIASTGLHTNGYSLALKVLLEHSKLSLNSTIKELGIPLKDELMKVHKSYLDDVNKIKEFAEIKGMAHITGGGLIENIPRVLPENCSVEIKKKSWKILPIFELIKSKGNVPEDEMYRTFNMGIGFVVVVSKDDAKKALKKNKGNIIGKVVKGNGEVILND